MSEITVGNIEILREKFKLSYQEATSYLERTNGNLVDALNLIERETEENKSGKDEILSKLRKILEKGNATKIIIRKDGEKFFEIPVTVGLSVSFILGLISPVFIWFGIIIGAVTSIKVEVVKEDGSVEEVNKILKAVGSDLKEKAGENIEVIRGKAGEVSENIMNKAGEVSENIMSRAGEMTDNIKSKANELSENIKVKSGEMKDKAVDGVSKIKDQVQDKSAEAQDEIKKKISDAKDASGNMFGKLNDKMNVSNLKKDDNSFTYRVDFDDDQIKYNKENDNTDNNINNINNFNLDE